MIECGLDIECHHHEVATGGQCEIDQRFDTLVKIGRQHDDCTSTASATSRISTARRVTFMPKPLFGDNGSGMHVHQSLWKDGKPLFAGDLYAGLEPDGAVVHRRPAEARARSCGHHRADHEQLQAAGAGLRSAGEPGVFAPQPFGGGAHSDVLGESEVEARRIPSAGSVRQSVPGVRGDDDGRARRRAQQDRSRRVRSTRISTICRRKR